MGENEFLRSERIAYGRSFTVSNPSRAIEVDLPNRGKVFEMSHDCVIIKNCLSLWMTGSVSWDRMLEQMVSIISQSIGQQFIGKHPTEAVFVNYQTFLRISAEFHMHQEAIHRKEMNLDPLIEAAILTEATIIQNICLLHKIHKQVLAEAIAQAQNSPHPTSFTVPA